MDLLGHHEEGSLKELLEKVFGVRSEESGHTWNALGGLPPDISQ